MQRIRTCLNCGKYNESPFNKIHDGCECTDEDIQKFSDDQMKHLNRMVSGTSPPSISECKRILLANGYNVKRNKKIKRKSKTS